MDIERELKDLGYIVLELAKTTRKNEDDMKILQTLVTENMAASIALMDGLKRTALHQQNHITTLEQKIIHMKLDIGEKV